MEFKYFSIRVYGLVVNSKNQLLITDEYIYGQRMTKFIGGGLEFGEGTLACILREFAEETQVILPPTLPQHFYATEQCIVSTFRQNTQVIPVYYTLCTDALNHLPTLSSPFDFECIEGAQGFRWINLHNFDAEQHLTFETDRIAIKKFISSL
jgi:8-oxo-dGTP pyrophosphatase MutT (NUDIX family)